jgi:hypothetical protein
MSVIVKFAEVLGLPVAIPCSVKVATSLFVPGSTCVRIGVEPKFPVIVILPLVVTSFALPVTIKGITVPSATLVVLTEAVKVLPSPALEGVTAVENAGEGGGGAGTVKTLCGAKVPKSGFFAEGLIQMPSLM